MTEVAATQMRVGDIVDAHGARFEIVQQLNHPTMKGPSEVVANIGRWIEGRIECGYFGPGVNFNFQGNSHSRYTIINR